MKKLIATLSIVLITASLFAMVAIPEGPQFVLNAQVPGILFHGFTTKTYDSSDALLAGRDDIELDASVKGISLVSNKPQKVGSYAIYSTNKVQSTVTFVTAPLQLTAADATYYVPYLLTYTSTINDKVTFIAENVGKALQATTDGTDLEAKAPIVKTKDNSAGLRYGILDLAVTFAGDENVSFGLPEASNEDFYTGTIIAMINVD